MEQGVIYMRIERFSNHKENLDEMLGRIAESIQLDDSRKKRMESAYSAIEALLNSDQTFFSKYKFEIYPQGSVKIGTTVKPIANDEFDLDVVIHLITNWKEHSPLSIYNELKRTLLASEKYRNKIELKSRCIRLNYTNCSA